MEGFFYNPNIHPVEEYHRRLGFAKQVAQQLHFPLFDLPYSPEEWDAVTGGLENEPEGGNRCPFCYRLRLYSAYLFFKERRAEAFTTTLTVSPNKPATIINSIGQEIGGDKFLQRDFKKKDGFKRSGELARNWGLYRQHYCGCRFSLRG